MEYKPPKIKHTYKTPLTCLKALTRHRPPRMYILMETAITDLLIQNTMIKLKKAWGEKAKKKTLSVSPN